MHLKDFSVQILSQLMEVTRQLTNEQFARPIALLSGNSFSKHLRHVLEFYDIMIRGYALGVINYDSRNHDKILENDRKATIDKMQELIRLMGKIEQDKTLRMEGSYGDEKYKIQTNIEREMAYNIEHAVHHMAIMRIVLNTEFPEISIDKNFGVAYSTIKYREQEARSRNRAAGRSEVRSITPDS